MAQNGEVFRATADVRTLLIFTESYIKYPMKRVFNLAVGANSIE